MHRQKAKCLLHLNDDCHAIIEKRITIPSRHLPSYPVVSHHKRHQRIYVTNQLMDNFYVFSDILIEKCSFYAACQFNAKLGAIDQVTLDDQPVGQTWSISMFKLHFFWLEFWTFFLKFYAVNLCKKTVWVCSFCKLHRFTIFYTIIYSQCYKIYFLSFINWLNAGTLLQLADACGIDYMTRTISLD